MSEVKIRYFGVSAFQITTESGVRILIDPYIENNVQSPVRLKDLDPPDLVLATHGGRDHVGDTLELARTSNCIVMADNSVSDYLLRSGIPKERVQAMIYGYVKHFKGVTVRAVEAKHSSILRLVDPPIYGNPLGFIIYTEDDLRIYHFGDTAIFGDMKMISELYRPDVGLICVGAFVGDQAEMHPDDGAIACRWLGLKLALPMHYVDGSNEPQLFEEFVAKESPQTRVKIMEPGQEIALDPADFRKR